MPLRAVSICASFLTLPRSARPDSPAGRASTPPTSVGASFLPESFLVLVGRTFALHLCVSRRSHYPARFSLFASNSYFAFRKPDIFRGLKKTFLVMREKPRKQFPAL